MRKEAIWSSLPGDSNLPPGVSQGDIDDRFSSPEDDIVGNQPGESEIDVNWQEFGKWYSTGGDSLPPLFLNRSEPSTINVFYIYSHDYNDNASSGIKPIKVMDYLTKQELTDPNLLQALVDFYEDKIKEDIEIFEEDAKSERQPGYGQPEYDPDDIGF